MIGQQGSHCGRSQQPPPWRDILGRFPHPAFPLSILASLSAGIGEEIAFRGFVLGFWALLLNWAFRRFNGRSAALWTAKVIAALAFAAGHLGTVVAMTNATSLADLNPVLPVEIVLLHGIVGLVAGQQYLVTGLVAAVGVHFWTDVFWHVHWGLFPWASPKIRACSGTGSVL